MKSTAKVEGPVAAPPEPIDRTKVRMQVQQCLAVLRSAPAGHRHSAVVQVALHCQ